MKLTVPAIASCFILITSFVGANEISGYGTAHVSADTIRVTEEGHSAIASNSSRLGIKGDYQLDNGLKLFFQYEMGVDLTAQGDNDGNGVGDQYKNKIFTHLRPSFIGISGGFGKVQVGHMPASDQWVNDYNLFVDQIGDLGNLWTGTGIPIRSDNVIYYSSPKFHDFDISLTYKPEQGEDDNSNIIIKGNYTDKRLKIGVALASLDQGVDHTNEHTVVAITGSYNFDYFTFGGGLQSEFDVKGKDDSDRDSFFIGGTVSLTKNGKLKVQFSKSIGSGVDRNATLFALGYDYQLNSNTLLYVAYANMANEYNLAFSVNGKGHGEKTPLALGESPSAFSLGIIYKFDLSLTKLL